MYAYVGEFAFGLSFLVFAVMLRWFRSHEDAHWVEVWMLPELCAVAMVGVWSFTGAVFGKNLLEAWEAHDITGGLVAIGVTAAGLAVSVLAYKGLRPRAAAQPNVVGAGRKAAA
ncbi:MAG: hypothetical protein RIM80_27640 [Alphaproteobacteria bacterium]